ncbi:MAG: accessory factor UbiK family protein [Pseudomonadota bacterium]
MSIKKQPETDVGKMFNTAITGITGMVGDFKSQFNSKIESYLAKLDLVKREEFEVVKSMLVEIRKEQKELKKKLEQKSSD